MAEPGDFNISSVNNGNEEAFDLLFTEYYNKLCNFAWSIIQDWYVVEDLTQDLLAEIWINRKKLKIESSLSGYLYRSMYHSCMDYLKHQKVIGKHANIAAVSETVSSGDSLVFEELQDKIERSISSLPEQCQKIFKLSRFDNLKYKEIAALLNISENSVDTQIRRALNKLRDDLKEYLITILIIFSIIF